MVHEPENTNGCGQTMSSHRARWKPHLCRSKLEEGQQAPEGFMTRSRQIFKRSSLEGKQVDELIWAYQTAREPSRTQQLRKQEQVEGQDERPTSVTSGNMTIFT